MKGGMKMAENINTRDIFKELKSAGVIDVKQMNQIITEFNKVILDALKAGKKVTLNRLVSFEPQGEKSYTGTMNGKSYNTTVKNFIKVGILSALKKVE